MSVMKQKDDIRTIVMNQFGFTHDVRFFALTFFRKRMTPVLLFSCARYKVLSTIQIHWQTGHIRVCIPRMVDCYYHAFCSFASMNELIRTLWEIGQ